MTETKSPRFDFVPVSCKQGLRCKASCKINIFDRKIEFLIFSPVKC